MGRDSSPTLHPYYFEVPVVPITSFNLVGDLRVYSTTSRALKLFSLENACGILVVCYLLGRVCYFLPTGHAANH